MTTQIFVPALVLVLWTLLMLVWGTVARGADAKRLNVNDPEMGKRTADVANTLSSRSQYKIDNYNHLTEQPTLFYAVAIILAVLGATGVNITLAWAYVGLRIAHSVVHATTNPVMVRFAFFGLSTIALAWMAVNALRLVM